VIGQSLAQARGRVTKHAIKPVDRLLSNDGIDVWDSFARRVPQRVGERKSIRVAMDWTDYDADNQSQQGILVGEDAHLAGAALDLLLDGTFDRIGGAHPAPMRLRMARVGA